MTPGVRVVIRDAEWIVRRVDHAPKGFQLVCDGVSELVRGREAIFLTALERQIEVLDPANTELVPDESAQFADSILYMESQLRQAVPNDAGIHVGHTAAMDLVQYQLDPARLALAQPRQRILIADAVGLGKTMEAGILVSELIARGRGRRILVLAVKSMLAQFQKEFWNRFTIPLTRLDSIGIQRVRSRIPTNHNPFYYYDKSIISIDTLKQDAEYRTYLEQAYWDIIVIDEAHNVADRGTRSLRSRLAKLLAKRSDALIMLSATPHDGKAKSFASLVNMLDATAIADPDDYSKEDFRPGLVIRRFKKDIQDQVQEAFQDREVVTRCFPASEAEEAAYRALLDVRVAGKGSFTTGRDLFLVSLEKALFSSPAACMETVDQRLKRRKRDLTDGNADLTLSTEIDTLQELRTFLEQITAKSYAKYEALLEAIRGGCPFNWKPNDSADRLVIFTERIATLHWLETHLADDLDLDPRQIETLHGGMSDVEQQRVVEDFGNTQRPVRLLICSDVAAEGINLHYHCHRLIHFDMPWSLMVFQQRNGRVDRYGQTATPQIAYLVTESSNETIRGDTRILEVLKEKDEQAYKNIGDPSVFMDVHDVDEEEKVTQRAIAAGEPADHFDSRLTGKPSEGESLLQMFLHPEDLHYCEDALHQLQSGGNPFVLRGDIALQDFGPRSALPVYPAPLSDRDGVEAIAGRQRKSWYQTWAQKVLTPVNVLAATQNTGDVLRVALDALVAAGLVKTLPTRRTTVWALDPERFHVTADTTVVRCQNSQRALVVPSDEADSWLGVPCLDLGAQDHYAIKEPGKPTWAGHLYLDSEIRRIVSAEHTALVPREQRDRLQERFAASDPKPWEPNLLSATPTLELGVDIGDLSSVVMCSVPPAPVNYVQRTGRAGRRDGNSLNLTVATGQPHDLYYYADPVEMLGSRIDPPGIFLNAPAVLERQLTAFCLDCWVSSGVDEDAVPRRIRPVLDNVEKANAEGFPYPLFDFIAENGEDLLARFFAAFEPRSHADDGLDESSRDYLTAFLHGADSEDSLRLRILKRLGDVAADRRALRKDVEALGRHIRSLRRGPTDEASEDRLRQLTGERSALQRLLREINRRETFGFLTDEGLLPNYAFPEQGVTLNSVIYRRRQNDAGETEDDAIVYDYVRPAVAALGEFAPENEFYAGGRRVMIQRIDTRVSPIERWRLCRSCAHCENMELGDHHSACPSCGDTMWGDAGQVREMLRLRLVHAATPDRYSRIMDERDDREPLFYTRQLVATLDLATVSRAFASDSPDRPFGFEYVPSATFREINFGRLDEQSSATTFAGETMPRKGFSICRRCGGVQSQDGAVQHTFICSAGGDADIADCLYLYREFKSEAIRMLIPPPSSMDVERHISSFIAALELGLRGQFAGAVDHLRVMTCKFPAAESGADLTFLMLYDTVPGGTGYLKQMMNDTENVLNIFRLAT